MNQVLEIWLAGSADLRRWEAVAAFAIGFFPLVATQVVLRAASAPLRVSSRPLDSDYPLSQLDGLNIWYEARLIEENIDDMQNLSTANFVDVVLHTRVPVGRLVDWVDQSFLFLHLDRVERGIRENRQARRQPSGSSPAAPESAGLGSPGAARIVGESVRPSSRGGTWTPSKSGRWCGSSARRMVWLRCGTGTPGACRCAATVCLPRRGRPPSSGSPITEGCPRPLTKPLTRPPPDRACRATGRRQPQGCVPVGAAAVKGPARRRP